jgi:hypothetical protein
MASLFNPAAASSLEVAICTSALVFSIVSDLTHERASWARPVSTAVRVKACNEALSSGFSFSAFT